MGGQRISPIRVEAGEKGARTMVRRNYWQEVDEEKETGREVLLDFLAGFFGMLLLFGAIWLVLWSFH